jgi:Fe-S-cluster containining protein
VPDSGKDMVQIPESCEGCGLCCINDNDTKWIEVSIEDAKRIPVEFLQEGDTEPFAMKQTTDGRCVCLDDQNRCSIYPLRPTICKVVTRADDVCVTSIKRCSR